MNKEQDFLDSERLESPLDAAINATLAEPLPEESIARVKVGAKLLARSTISTRSSAIRRNEPDRREDYRSIELRTSRPLECKHRCRDGTGRCDHNAVDRPLGQPRVCSSGQKNEGHQLGATDDGHTVWKAAGDRQPNAAERPSDARRCERWPAHSTGGL